MAISFRSAHSANATSVAITTPAAGDLILVFAYRNTSTTAPSLDGTYTNITTQSPGGSGNSARLAYRIATGAETTSGTWTNATQVVALIYRGTTATPIGTVTADAGNSATINYQTNALSDASGASWVAGVAGGVGVTAGMGGAVTGFTPRTNQVKANGLDTNAGVTSWSAQTLGVTTSGRWLSWTVELLALGENPAPRGGARVAATLALLLLPWQASVGWTVPPPSPEKIAPLVEIAQIDNPPPRDLRILQRVIGAWWRPILHGTGGSAPPDAPAQIDDPPFDSRRAARGPIYASWKWRPIGSGSAAAAAVADAVPPRGTPINGILDAWRSAPPLPQVRARVATLLGASIDPPPIAGRATLFRTIAAAWEYPPFPTPPRGPELTPASIDPPPVVGLAGRLATIHAAWLPTLSAPQRAPELVPIAAVVINDPPFDGRRAALGPIYSAWKWRPVGSGSSAAIPPQIDDPPFAQRPAHLQIIVSTWQPPRIVIVWDDVLEPDSIDDPPRKSRALELALIGQSWRPAPPIPRQGAHLPASITAVPVDDPPPFRRALERILAVAWQPAPPLPQRPDLLVQGAAAVGINDPPFDGRRAALGPIYSAWKWRPVGSGGVTPTVADAPPPRQIYARDQVPGQWVPTFQMPPRAPFLVPIPPVIDNPPISRRPAHVQIAVAAWQPPQILPVWSEVLQPDSIDNPPWRSRALEMALIGLSWRPAPPLPPRPTLLVQGAAPPVVDDPPFDGRRTSRGPIYGAWAPAWALPARPAELIQEAPAPVINDPPFDGRRAEYGPIVPAWQPPAPLPPRLLSVVQGAPEAPVTDPPFDSRQAARGPIWLGWQPAPPLPTRPALLVQGAVVVADAPPPPSDVHLWAILSTWQPAFILLPVRPPQVQPAPAITPDAPPPLYRPWLGPVLVGWLPAPPAPIRTPPSVATQPGISIDEPPPKSWHRLPSILAAWEPGPPRAQWGRHLPPVLADVPIHNPPFAVRPWLASVTRSWQPGPPRPITHVVVVTDSAPPPPPLVTGVVSMSTAMPTVSGGSTVTVFTAGGGTTTVIISGGGPPRREG